MAKQRERFEKKDYALTEEVMKRVFRLPKYCLFLKHMVEWNSFTNTVLVLDYI
jgi:hypothetical protein